MSFTAFIRSLRMKYSGKHNQAVLTKLERNALERERERDIKMLQSDDDCQGETVSGPSKAKQRKRRKREETSYLFPPTSKAVGSIYFCLPAP